MLARSRSSLGPVNLATSCLKIITDRHVGGRARVPAARGPGQDPLHARAIRRREGEESQRLPPAAHIAKLLEVDIPWKRDNSFYNRLQYL